MRPPQLAVSRLGCTITPQKLDGLWSGSMRTVYLNELEIDALDRQNLDTHSDDGWQVFLIRLQQKVDRPTGCLHLDARDLEQIPRYAFDYANGNWEACLVAVFGRALGPRLGR